MRCRIQEREKGIKDSSQEGEREMQASSQKALPKAPQSPLGSPLNRPVVLPLKLASPSSIMVVGEGGETDTTNRHHHTTNRHHYTTIVPASACDAQTGYLSFTGPTLSVHTCNHVMTPPSGVWGGGGGGGGSGVGIGHPPPAPFPPPLAHSRSQEGLESPLSPRETTSQESLVLTPGRNSQNQLCSKTARMTFENWNRLARGRSEKARL
jgi:hypothetical protein